MSMCVFAGELFKEMTVDYERATSEERLDEVRVSDRECIYPKHSPNQPSLKYISLKNHPQKKPIRTQNPLLTVMSF